MKENVSGCFFSEHSVVALRPTFLLAHAIRCLDNPRDAFGSIARIFRDWIHPRIGLGWVT